MPSRIAVVRPSFVAALTSPWARGAAPCAAGPRATVPPHPYFPAPSRHGAAWRLASRILRTSGHFTRSVSVTIPKV